MKLQTKLGIGGAAMFVFSILFGWVIFPAVYKSQVHAAVSLVPKTDMRELWSNLPFPWIFKIYLFNVTNPVEIQNGEKPIVQEIGPYYYDEWKKKVNLVDHEEDDTIEFNSKTTWYFNASRSNGLTGDEELIFPHLGIMSIVMVTATTKPTAIGVTSKAIDSIFKKPVSVFVKATAREIIFDGLPIDCTVKDFAGSAVCAVLKAQSEDLRVVGEDKYLVSLFGHRNGTPSAVTTRISRGSKRSKDLGRVVEHNNQSIQTVWSGDECNAFNGTEGTIFHSFFDKDDDVVAFVPQMCRSLSVRWERKGEAYGYPTNHYVADLGDQSSNPKEKCFCPTPETCLKKGAMDLARCIGTPITATMPHFYEADPSYLDTVSGLNPNKKDHEIAVDIEPITGVPVQFQISLQFNMFIFPIEKFKLMKAFPRALLPLFWIEENIEMTDVVISQIRTVYLVKTIGSCLTWIMLVGGLGLIGASVALEYKRRNAGDKLEVTPVTPALAIDNANNSAGEVQKLPINIRTTEPSAVPVSVDKN